MALKTMDISEARIRFDELLSFVEAGDEIIIARDEKPMARLVPVQGAPAYVPGKKRTPGLGRGEGWISEDFDDPLPDEFWMGEE